MITIGRPYIEEHDQGVFLKCHIVDETRGYDNDLWYCVDTTYADKLCPEVSDAFVLVMLLPAIQTKQNIVVKSDVSEKLYHNLRTVVLSSLTWAYYKQFGSVIDIHVEGKLVSYNFHPSAIATGCSLGVDSFSTIKRYFLDNDCEPGYRLTHLTFFNVGAVGSTNSDSVRQSYIKDIERITNFAKECNLPIVKVDSNICDFYPIFDFNATHTFRNMSVVLALQKLFKRYLYASAFPNRYIRIDKEDLAHYESILLPHISTESTELISADSELSRTEKLKYISTDIYAQNLLYVCRKDQARNDGELDFLNADDDEMYVNCGHCDKCLRTILALDIIGKLDCFKHRFDLSYWSEGGGQYTYIAKVLNGRKKDLAFLDLYQNMCVYKYDIPIKARMLYLRSVLYKCYRFVYKRLQKVFRMLIFRN